MISLREENETLRLKCTELETELANVKPEPLPDLEEVRDRILKNLKRGTQASEYKISKRALDQFIRELQRR
jgi:hypothetical protein